MSEELLKKIVRFGEHRRAVGEHCGRNQREAELAMGLAADLYREIKDALAAPPPADVRELVAAYGAACEEVGERAGLNRLAELSHASNAEAALLAAVAARHAAADKMAAGIEAWWHDHAFERDYDSDGAPHLHYVYAPDMVDAAAAYRALNPTTKPGE